jgi:hypothetical protein
MSNILEPTPAQRREQLLAWLRENFSQVAFTTEQVSMGARIMVVLRPLYEGDDLMKKCGRDLAALRKEGYVEKDKASGTWRLR